MGWQPGPGDEADAGRPAEVPGAGDVPGGARDPRLAAFAPVDGKYVPVPSGVLALAADQVSGPGRRCPGASDDELAGLAKAWAAVESWAAAGKLGVIAEMISRDEAPPGAWSASLRHELAAALACSAQSAEVTAWLAWEQRARLPGTGALLADGTLAYGKARAVTETFRYLSDADAAAAEAMIAGQLAGRTYPQVLRLAEQAALSVDPELAARRREQAQNKDARVSLFREQQGTAGLAGRDLPPDEALAAMAAVNARAQQYRDSGAFGDARMDRLRACAYLDLLNGVPPDGRIAAAAPADEAADAAADLAWTRARAAKTVGSPAGEDGGAGRQPGTAGQPGPGYEPSPGDEPGTGGRRPGDSDGGCPPGCGCDDSSGGKPADHQAGAASLAGDAPGLDRCAASRHAHREDVDDPTDHGAPASPADGETAGPGPHANGGDNNDEPGDGSDPDNPNNPEGDPGGGPGPGGSGPDPSGASPGPGTSPAGRALQLRPPDLVVPLATLLGLAERPGEIQGFGLLDPALARQLAAAAAASPHTKICLTVTSPEGYAIGHGCARTARAPRGDPSGGPPGVLSGLPARLNLTVPATALPGFARDARYAGPWALIPSGDPDPGGRARPPDQGRPPAGTRPPGKERPPDGTGPSDRDGPPRGTAPPGTPDLAAYGTWTLHLPGGRRLTVGLDPVPTYDCDHCHQTAAYQPGDKLRHLVQVRDGTCTFPTCNRHARESDFDHARPYDKGGRTCACNAGARSRACHRVKQAPGWNLTQPKPGWHQWQTPAGLTYLQEPWRYPA